MRKGKERCAPFFPVGCQIWQHGHPNVEKVQSRVNVTRDPVRSKSVLSFNKHPDAGHPHFARPGDPDGFGLLWAAVTLANLHRPAAAWRVWATSKALPVRHGTKLECRDSKLS